MRAPLRNKRGPQAPVSRTVSYPAPVGGWNARDALADMGVTDAVSLVNWFPRPSYVEFRGGHASHATGMTGTGKTLIVHNAVAGTAKMFCTTESGIYNVSAAGAVGASVLSRTNGKHQWTMFGDGTSNWLIAVNGVDKPAYYDNTTWTAVDSGTSPALTGLTTTSIVGVNVYKGRLFFLEKNSLAFWYLPAGVAGGTLTKFDLSGECAKGGYLVAMATWTRDSGAGADDVAVFFTSQGEAIVYQGNNPSSASFWSKVGTYSIGRPLGYRCVTQYGGDCVVLTENGVFPMTTLLQSGDTERAKFALSYKIQDSITAAARSYGSTFGWKSVVFPAQDALLVNVPITENGEHEQYVMNLTTKAWCKFTEWDAEDFAIYAGELYFVKGTVVYKAWTGTSDLSANISYYAKQAFQAFGSQQPKHVKLFMPILSVNGPVTYAVDIDVDFSENEISGTATASAAGRALWGTAKWGQSQWGGAALIVRQWSSPSEWAGRWVAGKIKITSLSLACKWMGNSIVYEESPSL